MGDTATLVSCQVNCSVCGSPLEPEGVPLPASALGGRCRLCVYAYRRLCEDGDDLFEWVTKVADTAAKRALLEEKEARKAAREREDLGW